jgi:hypothetical protein
LLVNAGTVLTFVEVQQETGCRSSHKGRRIGRNQYSWRFLWWQLGIFGKPEIIF